MDLDHQLADGGERATVDDLAFDDPEPDLDEVRQQAASLTGLRGKPLLCRYAPSTRSSGTDAMSTTL
jgi:hypothetical protein